MNTVKSISQSFCGLIVQCISVSSGSDAEILSPLPTPTPVPEKVVITGNSKEVFHYYGLDAEGIAGKIRDNIQ